jgi:hypothetical protein
MIKNIKAIQLQTCAIKHILGTRVSYTWGCVIRTHLEANNTSLFHRCAIISQKTCIIYTCILDASPSLETNFIPKNICKRCQI